MTLQDALAITLLIFMEGVLSLDNALVLAVMVSPLPKSMQKKALTYGMAGAWGFRIAALSVVTFLLRWTWVKFVGGGYLLYLAIGHFLGKEDGDPEAAALSPTAALWRTIVAVELTDIAFSMDSILAAMAVSPKLWVICIGGILGIIMMRFAATIFVRLLELYPALNHTAYGLVGTIGVKLVLEGFGTNFHEGLPLVVFWGSMLIWIASGLLVHNEVAVP